MAARQAVSAASLGWLMAVAVACIAFLQPSDDEIVVKRLLVKDAAGKTRAALAADEEVGLILFDSNGAAKLTMGTSGDEVYLNLLGKSDVNQLTLGVSEGTGGSFWLRDASGTTRLLASLLEAGGGVASLGLMDSQGRLRLGLAHGGPSNGVYVYSPDGKPRIELDTTETGASRLTLKDSNGTTKAAALVRDDTVQLVIRDADGKDRVVAGAVPAGAAVQVFDSQGKKQGSIP